MKTFQCSLLAKNIFLLFLFTVCHGLAGAQTYVCYLKETFNSPFNSDKGYFECDESTRKFYDDKSQTATFIVDGNTLKWYGNDNNLLFTGNSEDKGASFGGVMDGGRVLVTLTSGSDSPEIVGVKVMYIKTLDCEFYAVIQAKAEDSAINKAQPSSGIINLFKYPFGEKSIAWNSKFPDVQKAMPDMGKVSTGRSDKEFTLSRSLMVNGVAYNTLSYGQYRLDNATGNYNFSHERILIYSTIDNPQRNGGVNPMYMLTNESKELYAQILADVKSAGGKIVKWKSSDHNRLQSCRLELDGKYFYITLLKGISQGYSHIEINHSDIYVLK